MMFRGFSTMVLLTLHEALRRKIVLAAFLCALVFIGAVVTGQYFVTAQDYIAHAPLVEKVQLAMTTAVALYAAHFFIILITIVLSIDTVSGEIQSGIMQTVATKPIRRLEILLGKWAAYYIVSAAFAFLLVGGVLLSGYLLGSYRSADLWMGLLLMLVEIAFMLTVAIAGGTVFGTVVNGIVAFAFFAIAFVGGWIEQIGRLAGSEGAHNVGVTLSLLSPGDAMWRLAAFHLQPGLAHYISDTPFTSTELANGRMVAWTLAYTVLVFAAGLRVFSRRSL